MNVCEESPIDLDIHPRLPEGKGRERGIGCVGAGFVMRDCHLVAYRRWGLNPAAITSRRREQASEAAALRGVPNVCETLAEMLALPEVEVVDVAVPPDQQRRVIEEVCRNGRFVKGILAQKPLGIDLREAAAIVEVCKQAGKRLLVNQNMRYDHSVRACKRLLDSGSLGTPVLATIELRAVPHWMPWQERQGWVSLRVLSIHHLDCFRYWLGEPERVYASVRSDPRTARRFEHEDGVCLYILEFPSGARALGCDDVWAGPGREGAAADDFIRWRVEGTKGTAKGTIGWPSYPAHTPSTIDFTSTDWGATWFSPRWAEAWFPDAFAGPMAELLCCLETGVPSELDGAANLRTMALVEACYRSVRTHAAESPRAMLDQLAPTASDG